MTFLFVVLYAPLLLALFSDAYRDSHRRVFSVFSNSIFLRFGFSGCFLLLCSPPFSFLPSSPASSVSQNNDECNWWLWAALPCPDFKGNVSPVSLLRKHLAVSDTPNRVKEVPFYSWFAESFFYQNECWILSHTFSCLLTWSWGFFFSSNSRRGSDILDLLFFFFLNQCILLGNPNISWKFLLRLDLISSQAFLSPGVVRKGSFLFLLQHLSTAVMWGFLLSHLPRKQLRSTFSAFCKGVHESPLLLSPAAVSGSEMPFPWDAPCARLSPTTWPGLLRTHVKLQGVCGLGDRINWFLNCAS